MRFAALAIFLPFAADIGHGRQGGTLKILYIDHLPRWEYRYLKNAMVSDPGLVCHTYLASAEKGFLHSHSIPKGRSEHTLKRYAAFFEPIKKLPREMSEWLRYDVVVLGDMSPSELGRVASENLEAFVREHGGGLVHIMGSRNGPEAYSGTSLERVMPVVPSADKPKAAFDKPLAYALTSSHCITQFEADANKNKKLWEEADGIPGVLWYKPVKAVKPEASVLVEIKEPKAPLFIASSYGRGRVFTSLTDETWHWRHLRGDEPYFYPFWKRVFAWAGCKKH